MTILLANETSRKWDQLLYTVRGNRGFHQNLYKGSNGYGVWFATTYSTQTSYSEACMGLGNLQTLQCSRKCLLHKAKSYDLTQTEATCHNGIALHV